MDVEVPDPKKPTMMSHVGQQCITLFSNNQPAACILPSADGKTFRAVIGTQPDALAGTGVNLGVFNSAEEAKDALSQEMGMDLKTS